MKMMEGNLKPMKWDTTDEELVDDDSLPNELAMRLFTPACFGHKPDVNCWSYCRSREEETSEENGRDREERKTWRRRLMLGSGPPAADILAGNWKDEAGDGGYASSPLQIRWSNPAKGNKKPPHLLTKDQIS
jgi:hypothetical protein